MQNPVHSAPSIQVVIITDQKAIIKDPHEQLKAEIQGFPLELPLNHRLNNMGRQGLPSNLPPLSTPPIRKKGINCISFLLLVF